MKYMDIYHKIPNPLDDEKVIEKMLDAYADKTAFYTALTNRNSKDKKRYYSISQSDALYALLFNTWKKDMLSIPTSYYEQAIRNGLFQKDVYKVLELLRKTTDVSTKQEAEQVLNKQYNDKELTTAMEKYRWDSIGLDSGWTHISSRYVHAKKVALPKIEHRLYINALSTDLHELSRIFLEKCTSKKLPYYFKISEYDRRDDNIVIYSDTKNLPKYLQVLSEIEKEYPQIIERCGEPPILTGKIGSWVGYGSEPLCEHSSFNSVRADVIKNSIEQEMKAWFRKNATTNVQFEGQTISLYQYLSKKIVEKEFANSKRILERNPKSIYARYSLDEMANPNVATAIEQFLTPQIVPIIDAYLKGDSKGKEIKFKMYDKERKIYGCDIIDELMAFVPIINKNNKTFGQRIKKRIEEESKRIGIDSHKYCFDIENVELLRKADAVHTQQEQPRVSTTFASEDSSQPITPPTEYKYRPMTAAEILDSQRKLAEIPVAKVKVNK